MSNLIKLIKGNYFIVVFVFIIFSAMLYSFFELFYTAKYWNVLYNGEIEKLRYQYNEVDSEKGKTYIYYTIFTDLNYYVAKTPESENYKLGDKVTIMPNGGNTCKILKVNGRKVANKIGGSKIFSIIILLILFILFGLSIKKRKLKVNKKSTLGNTV